MDAGAYRVCWSTDEWRACLREAGGSTDVALDFETGPDDWTGSASAIRAEEGSHVIGIGLAWHRDGAIHSAYCPIGHHRANAGGGQVPRRAALGLLDDFVRDRDGDPSLLIVVANLAMELSFMLREGVAWPLQGQLHDIQVATRILNKGIGFKELIGLKAMQQHVLGRDMAAKTDLDAWLTKRKFKPGRDIWRAPVALAAPYCGGPEGDAADTLRLWLRWKALVYQPRTDWWWHRRADHKSRLDLYELEIETAVQALSSCLRGTKYDVPLCERRSSAASMLKEACRRWICDHLEMPTANPGSQVQMRGIIFSDSFGAEPSTAHMTDAFRKLTDRDQQAVLDSGRIKVMDYASLDIDALRHYEREHPGHADFFFMLAAYRKCQTALMWFQDVVDEFGRICQDPWWSDEDAREFVALVFHRLRTVGTISGRMASSDYNGQQVPKRFKMLLDADRLVRILCVFLPDSQMSELLANLDESNVRPGDEEKATGLSANDRVFDFSVRAMFVARGGHRLRDWDLSQVEMRGFAHFTGNPLLCRGYGAAVPDPNIDEELDRLRAVVAGADPAEALAGLNLRRHVDAPDEFDAHQLVADEIEIHRKDAKAVNFGIIYGMGLKKLVRGRGWSRGQGMAYLNRYFGRFPEIKLLQDSIKIKLRERGYIFDPFGRRYYLTPDRAYVGLNRLVQGWAAGAFKVGFVRTCELMSSSGFGGGAPHHITRRRTNDECRILTCVHDEMLGEVQERHDTGMLDFCVRSAMTDFHGLKTPLGASSERSYGSWDAMVAFGREAYDA